MGIYASLFEMTSEGIGMGWLQTHLLNPAKNMTCDDLIQWEHQIWKNEILIIKQNFNQARNFKLCMILDSSSSTSFDFLVLLSSF